MGSVLTTILYMGTSLRLGSAYVQSRSIVGL
jgi:hypothetical protein